MRTKAFVMSMGLAAGVLWMTGCQHTPAAKNAAMPCAGGCGATASHAKAPKSKIVEHAARPRLLNGPSHASAHPATTVACNSCAKCGGNCESLVAVKTPAATASCASCSAKTDGREVVVALPSMPAPPGAPGSVPHTLPNAPTNLPAAVPPVVADPASAPATNVTTNYGPGVDVVAAPVGADTLPAAPAPGEKTVDKNNVMTVRFGHANNYQIVVGQVYQFRRTWRLRYTAVESDDKYGGSFTLIGDNLDNLKDGQMIRVEGNVLPSDDRVGDSRYQVNRVEILEPDVK